MGKDFSRQTRRFFAAILTYGKGKRRSMAIGAPAKTEFSWGEEEGMERTHLSRPAVSHHLRVLREAGAVRVHRAGTRNYYYPNADAEQWKKLRTLAEHTCAVMRSAAEAGYPNLKEE